MASTTPSTPNKIEIVGYYHTIDPYYVSTQEGSNPVFVSSNHDQFAVDFLPGGADIDQFPLDFLPGGADGGWQIADSRDSLLLLYRGVKLPNVFHAKTKKRGVVIVCEPMTQQYKEVPCPPADLKGRYKCLGMFLLDGDKTRRCCCDGGGGGGISLSNFKVMAVLLRQHSYSSRRGVPVVCVFSAKSEAVKGAWWSSAFSALTMGSEVTMGGCAWSSNSVFAVGSDWHILKRAWDIEINVPSMVECFFFAGRACGSLYWGIEGTGTCATALVLDEATAAFSTAMLPEATLGSHGRRSFRVIGGGAGGAMRIVRLIDNELKVYARMHGGDGKWVVERLLRLRKATRGLPGREDGYFQGEAVIVDAHDSYVLLTPREKTWLFSVVLATMEVDRRHGRNKYAGPAYPWELPQPAPAQKLWSPLFCCIKSLLLK